MDAETNLKTNTSLNLILAKKHIGNALLNQVLASAVTAHQLPAHHLQLQKRVVDLFQHLVVQIGGLLLRNGVADLLHHYTKPPFTSATP